MSALPNVTADDMGALEQVGHDMITTIVALVVETMLYTVYAVLVGVAGYILLGKTRTRSAVILFIIILVMILLETSLWIVDLRSAIAELRITLTSHSDLSYKARYTEFQSLSGPEITAAVYAYMTTLGDIVIIWRVYAFWSQGLDRLVLIIPISLFIASCIVAALLSDCAARFGPAFYTITYGNYANPPFCRDIQRLSFLVAFLTTVISTLLILYKTWIYRREIGSHLRASGARARIERITTIFVESGFLYALFFLAAYVDSSPRVSALKESTTGSRFASTVWQYQTSKIVGIYPIVIILLVHSQRSYIDEATMTTRTAAVAPIFSSVALPISISETRTGSNSALCRDPSRCSGEQLEAVREQSEKVGSTVVVGEAV